MASLSPRSSSPLWSKKPPHPLLPVGNAMQVLTFSVFPTVRSCMEYIVAENRASLDYTQINYYFVVTTTHTPGKNHLTEAEQDSRTIVKRETFDEMVRLINEQEFDRVQGKYLKMRDVAAMLEKKHGCFDETPRDIHVISGETDLDAVAAQIAAG